MDEAKKIIEDRLTNRTNKNFLQAEKDYEKSLFCPEYVEEIKNLDTKFQ